MNKAELVSCIAEKSGLTKKDSEKALNAFMESITDALKADEKVTLAGFGIFEVKHRAERQGRNPKTSESITIAASAQPQFKAGRTLKDAVNE